MSATIKKENKTPPAKKTPPQPSNPPAAGSTTELLGSGSIPLSFSSPASLPLPPTTSIPNQQMMMMMMYAQQGATSPSTPYMPNLFPIYPTTPAASVKSPVSPATQSKVLLPKTSTSLPPSPYPITPTGYPMHFFPFASAPLVPTAASAATTATTTSAAPSTATAPKRKTSPVNNPSTQPNAKKRKYSRKKGKDTEHDEKLKQFVSTLVSEESLELDLSKSFDDQFTNETLRDVNWSKPSNLQYVAKNLPISIITMNLANFRNPHMDQFFPSIPLPVSQVLRTVDFSGGFGPVQPCYFKALKQMKQLKELDLSNWDWSAKGTNFTEMISSVADLQLTHLRLNGVHLDDRMAVDFFSRLSSTRCKDYITHLELNNNFLCGSFFATLQFLGNLEHLEVSYQDTVDDGFNQKMSTENIRQLTLLLRLKVLKLYGNSISNESVEILSKHPTIIDLDLGANSITDHGAQRLFENSILKKLILEGNYIKMTAKSRRYLAHNSTLEYLDLNDNLIDVNLVQQECARDSLFIVYSLEKKCYGGGMNNAHQTSTNGVEKFFATGFLDVEEDEEEEQDVDIAEFEQQQNEEENNNDDYWE